MLGEGQPVCARRGGEARKRICRSGSMRSPRPWSADSGLRQGLVLEPPADAVGEGLTTVGVPIPN